MCVHARTQTVKDSHYFRQKQIEIHTQHLKNGSCYRISDFPLSTENSSTPLEPNIRVLKGDKLTTLKHEHMALTALIKDSRAQRELRKGVKEEHSRQNLTKKLATTNPKTSLANHLSDHPKLHSVE